MFQVDLLCELSGLCCLRNDNGESDDEDSGIGEDNMSVQNNGTDTCSQDFQDVCHGMSYDVVLYGLCVLLLREEW